MKKNSQTIKTNTYYQGCPEGGVGGVAPLGNFVGKNIKGGTKGKIGRSLPPPPSLENFVRKKSQRENLTPPLEF
jgi:hypothetical protein